MKTVNQSISGAILAGGRSTRMGQDKAELEMQLVTGEQLTMLQLVHRALERVCDETLLIGGPERPGISAQRVPDILPNAGPLAGILSAVLAANNPRVFVVACDMPFVDPTVITGLAELIQDHNAVVPQVHGRLETLHAIYTTDCTRAIRKALDAGERRVRSFFSMIDVRIVTEDEFSLIDKSGRSSMNVNNPREFKAAAANLLAISD